jgi:hypothetical protein
MEFLGLVLIELLQFTNLRSKTVRPSDPNQQASIRPNLMSSAKRHSSNEGKILASLEKGGTASTLKANNAPVSGLWRKSRNSLLLLLCVGLAWLTYDNATSVTSGPLPIIAKLEPKPAIATAEVKPALPPPAAAMIREERVAAAPASVATSAPLPAAPPETMASTAPAAAVYAVNADKAKPQTRAVVPRKTTRAAPASVPDAAPPDSDVAILSAIVAQGHAAKAAAGR